MLTVNERQGIGELLLVPKTKDWGSRYPLQLKKILGKDISAALLFYKNGNPVVSGNFQDRKELLFYKGSDMITDGRLVHLILKLLHRLLPGKNAVKVPVTILISQTKHLHLHGAQALISHCGAVVLYILPRGIEISSRLLLKYLGLQNAPP